MAFRKFMDKIATAVENYSNLSRPDEPAQNFNLLEKYAEFYAVLSNKYFERGESGFIRLTGKEEDYSNFQDEKDAFVSISRKLLTALDKQMDNEDFPDVKILEKQQLISAMIANLENCEKALKLRKLQVEAYKICIKSATDILQFQVDPKLSVLKYSTESLEEKLEEQKKLANQEKEKIEILTKAYEKAKLEYIKLSDNFGDQVYQTDTLISKGKVYTWPERKANVYVEDAQVQLSVEKIYELIYKNLTPSSSVNGDKIVDNRATGDMRLLKRYIQEAEMCLQRDENLSSYTCRRLTTKLEKAVDHVLKEDSSDIEVDLVIDEAEGIISLLEKKLNDDEDKKEYAKSFQRVALPKWNGEHNSFRSWIEVQKKLNKGPDELIRVVQLKNSITNPETLLIVKHAKTFLEAVNILQERYGDSRVFVPKILTSIENLESNPKTRENESKNIQIILNAMIELQEYEALGDFNDHWLNRASNKLRNLTRDRWLRMAYSNHDQDLKLLQKSFEKFLTQELHLNYRLKLLSPEESTSDQDWKKKEKIEHKRINNNKTRSYQTKCYICESDHSIFSCPFLTDDKVIETLEKKKICTRCILLPCKGEKCGSYYNKKMNKSMSGDCKDGCKDNSGKPLNFKICGCTKKKKESITVVKSNRLKQKTYLPKVGSGICISEQICIQHKGKTKTINILYDKGSDSTLVHDGLSDMCVKESEGNVAVEMSDGSIKYIHNAPVFKISIKNQTGKNKENYELLALSFKKMTETKFFQVPIPREWQEKYKIPDTIMGTQQTVQLLLGMDANQLMPEEICKAGGLSLYRSKITGNYLVGGNIASAIFDSSMLHSARVRFEEFKSTAELFKKAVSIEDMDSPAVNKKRNDDFMEKKKLAEDKIISDNIVFNEEDGFYTVKLIHNDKLELLETNFFKVTKCQERLQKKMGQKPELMKLVNEQLQEYIEKGFWIKADIEILNDDNYQKAYVPYNYVFNEGSESTPVRIIVNSSLKGNNGISLNDTYLSGTSNLGDLKSLMLNVRCKQQLIMADIKKFFTNFRLRTEEKYLHCILIPINAEGVIGYGENISFETYVQDRLTFGDRPSPIAATLGRIKMAEEHSCSEKIKEIFKSGSYVDDIFAGTDYNEDVQKTIDEMKHVVEAAGMTFKKFYYSGMKVETENNDSVEMFSNEDTKALGYVWKVTTDELKLKIKLQLGKKDRGRSCVESLNLVNIQEQLKRITKRNALGLTMSLYDNIGIFTPISLSLRLRMQNIFSVVKNWDDFVPEPQLNEFRAAVEEALLMKDISIPRCVTPRLHDASFLPQLIGFSDASMQAVGFVFYVRYKLLNGCFTARLLTSKAKTSGVRKLSVPRAELLAFQMLAQSTEYMLRVLDIKFSETILLTDSMIVINQLQKPANEMDVFTGSRIDLIQTILKTNKTKILHVPGEHNPADYCTKICNASQLTGTFWKETNFLHLSENDWPTTTFSSLDYTGEVSAHKVASVQVIPTSVNLVEVFDITKYRSLKFVKKVIARILSWRYKEKNFTDLMLMAINVLEIDSVPETDQKMKKSTFFQYQRYVDKLGRTYLLNRGTEIQKPKKTMLVHGETFLGRLILLTAHDQYHGYGSRFIGSKIRENYYLPHLTKKLTKISKDCFKCRIIRKTELSQLMSPQKHIRTTCTPPFTYIVIDFIGPMSALDEVKRRTRMKIYFLLVSCLTTRAINVIVVRDLSTDGFILALRNHIAVRGSPKICYSDLGTNFVGGKRVLLDNELDIDIKKIRNYAENNSFEIRFGTPSHPEGQGAAEKSVHLYKTALTRNHSTTNFTFMEWVTIASETAALVNSRPLLLEPNTGESLSPYEILTWREVSAPLGPEVTDDNLTRRSFLQRNFVNSWFQRYKIAMEEKIMGYNNKWKRKNPNLKKGDIVLILDRPSVSLPFTYAIVKEINTGSDGLVRTVIVQYKDKNKKVWKKLSRHVSSLALLISKGPMLPDLWDDENDDQLPEGEPDLHDHQPEDTNDLEIITVPSTTDPLMVQFSRDENTPQIQDLKMLRKQK